MKKSILLLVFLFILFSCSNKGKRVPEFNYKTIENKTITDKTLEGKITVINVWATWCPNCLNELPELNKLVDKYEPDSSVVFIAVSDESEEKVCSFMERKVFKYQQIASADKLTDALQTRLVKTYPQHIIIGKDLKIKFENSSELKNASEILSKEIELLRSGNEQ